MRKQTSTVLAIFGDLEIGALFEQHGVIYRKLGRQTAREIGTETIFRFASFESVRAATFLYG